MREFLHDLRGGEAAFVHAFQRRVQCELHQRQAAGRAQVGLLLFFQCMRRVIGRQHVDRVFGQRAQQRFAIAEVLDRRVAFDEIAAARIVAAVETQEMDAGFRGDALAAAVGADQWAALEQRQLVGGGNVQHVQARVVFARERDRQFRGLDARLARADLAVEFHRNVIAVLFAILRQFGIDHRRVFAVGDDRRGRVAEHRGQHVRVVHQHVAGRCAHEHLHAGRGQRVDGADVVDVAGAGAHIEGVVAPGATFGAAVLVVQRGTVEGRRAGVGHVHEAGQAPGDRGRRFRGEVALVLQARFAEVDLVVDHARQQPAAGGVDHDLASARRQVAADGLDPAVGEAQVAVELAALVDQPGVDDEGGGMGGHGRGVVRSGRRTSGGTGSWPPGHRGWHRARRLTVSQLPLPAPKRWMASIEYSEQVGTKRQRCPRSGLIQRL